MHSGYKRTAVTATSVFWKQHGRESRGATHPSPWLLLASGTFSFVDRLACHYWLPYLPAWYCRQLRSPKLPNINLYKNLL